MADPERIIEVLELQAMNNSLFRRRRRSRHVQVSPLPNTSQLPFYRQKVEDLRNELGFPNPKYFSQPPHWWNPRGNYIRNYVLSNLRIQMKDIKPQVTWNLGPMWDLLPVELITLILGLLHPIDLYHAIRAAKGFRFFLLNRNSASIWKESFLNHPDIPFYPDDVSPPKWVSLIFGPATCDVCGRDNSLVDYAFRWRKCDECADYFTENAGVFPDDPDSRDDFADEFRDELMMATAVQPIIEDFPDQLEIIWKLATSTVREDSIHYYYPYDYPLRVRKFSIKQVKGISWRLWNYLSCAHTGMPGAESRYEKYLNVTLSTNDERMKNVRQCNSWAGDIEGRCQEAFTELLPSFCIKIIKVLPERGHDPRDIRMAIDHFKGAIYSEFWPNTTNFKLKKSNVQKILPQLEWWAAYYKRVRLSKESKERRKKVAFFYDAFIKTKFVFNLLPYLPRLGVDLNIVTPPVFEDYIANSQGSLVDFSVDSPQAPLLMDFTKIYLAKNNELLFKFLFTLLLDAGMLPDKVDKDSAPGDFAWLVIAVFECCGSVFVGWDEVGLHTCRDGKRLIQGIKNTPSDFLVSFSDVGYQVLKNLAQLLHLESLESISTEDLDAMSAWFVCKACQPTKKYGFQLYYMTWRECICHAVRARVYPPQYRHDAEFDILSEAITQVICLERECYLPLHSNETCCMHGHIYTLAKPTTPVSPENSRKMFKRRLESVDLHPNVNYQCLRCPEKRGLWQLPSSVSSLSYHLSNNHQIEFKDAVEGVDWTKIRALEDDTWVQERISQAP